MVLTVEPYGDRWAIFRSTNRGGKSEQPLEVFRTKARAIEEAKRKRGVDWGLVVFNEDLSVSRTVGSTNWTGAVSVSCYDGGCEVFVGVPDDADPIITYNDRGEAEKAAKEIAGEWDMEYFSRIEDYPGWP